MSASVNGKGVKNVVEYCSRLELEKMRLISWNIHLGCSHLIYYEEWVSSALPSLSLSGIAGHCCNPYVFDSTILSSFDHTQPAMMLYVSNSLENSRAVWVL